MAKLSVSTDRIYMEKISLFSSTDLPTEVAKKKVFMVSFDTINT